MVIGGEVDAGRRSQNDLREDGAGGGLVDTGHLLHRLRREGDLPAGDLTAPGVGHDPVQRVLDAIGVVERRRPERGVERTIAGAGAVHLERGAGGGGDGLGRQHAPTLAGTRASRSPVRRDDEDPSAAHFHAFGSALVRPRDDQPQPPTSRDDDGLDVSG